MADLRPEEQRFLQAAFAAGPACLTLDQLAALASDQMTSGDTVAARRHLEACPHCKTELSMLQDFERARPEAGEMAGVQWITRQLEGMQLPLPPIREPKAERLRKWFASLAAPRYRLAWGAAFVLVLAAGIYVERPGQPGRPVFDGGSQVLRSQGVVLNEPGGEISHVPAQFRWQKLEGATMYHVRLLNLDGKELWAMETTEISAAAPTGSLSPGRAYKWEVTARDAAGTVLGVSPLQNFHIVLTTR